MSPFIKDYLYSIKQLCPETTEEQLQSFGKHLYVKQFKSKDIIFEKGIIQNEICFLNNGLVRAYHLDDDKNDKTLWFVSENEFVTDYPAFIANEESNCTFEAIEDTTLVFIPKEALFEAFEKYSSCQKYGRLIAERVLKSDLDRVKSFQIKTAKERYLDVLNHPADIINRVPLGHIASFIGIKRQSLTRIRKQIQMQNDTKVSRQ